MRILVLTRHHYLGASSRLRFIDPFHSIAQNEEIRIAPFFSDSALLSKYRTGKYSIFTLLTAYFKRLSLYFSSRYFDVIWIEKEAIPGAPAKLEHLFLKKFRGVIVFDVDDNIMSHYANSESKYLRWLSRTKYQTLSRVSNFVCANDELRKVLERDFITSEVISSSFERTGFRNYPIRPRDSKDIRIGWIGTPQSAKDQLSHFIPLLETLHDEFDLILIGAGEDFAKSGFRVFEWSPETEAETLSTCHIGMMPLVNSEFNSTKSWHKAYKFLDVGRPVIIGELGPIQVNNLGLIREPDFTKWQESVRAIVSDWEHYRYICEAISSSLSDLPSVEAHAAAILKYLSTIGSN